MKAHMTLLASAVLISFTGSALAQATQDHQQHHPGAPATAGPTGAGAAARASPQQLRQPARRARCRWDK